MFRLLLTIGLVVAAGAPVHAGFREGLAAYYRLDYAAALAEWRPLAEQGDPRAQYQLGVLHYRGDGVAQDYGQAAKWFRRAAERGDPDAQFNLGLLYAGRGRFAEAESAYRTAIRLEASTIQAHVNLADLYRSQGRDDDGERVLREALTIAPEAAEVHHALGLLLVRRQRLPEALAALEQAASLLPENARFSYVYGVALHSTGDTDQALVVLERASVRHPDNRDLLTALATIHRDNGSLEAALRYARDLVALAPQDPTANQLLAQLQAQQNR